MKTYPFSDALGISKAVFYDLMAKKFRFNFRTLPDGKQMIFTAVENADAIKSVFPQFEIKQMVDKTRFVELVINYE